jgi:hypothetical protein
MLLLAKSQEFWFKRIDEFIFPCCCFCTIYEMILLNVGFLFAGQFHFHLLLVIHFNGLKCIKLLPCHRPVIDSLHELIYYLFYVIGNVCQFCIVSLLLFLPLLVLLHHVVLSLIHKLLGVGRILLLQPPVLLSLYTRKMIVGKINDLGNC